MILFRYRALDSKGNYQTGDWFGPSSKELYSHLRKQNLSLLSSKAIETKPWRYFSIKIETLIDFCIHLEQLDKVKMPLTDSIILIANSMDDRPFKAILYNLYYSITNGLLLSEACSLHPKIFDSIFVQSVTVAEKTGALGQTCNKLQNHFSWKKEQQIKIKQTLRYPLILSIILIFLLTFMVVFVIPHLQDYLEILGAKEKPLALKTLIALTNTIQNHGIIFLFVVLSIVISYFLLHKTSTLFFKINQRITLSVPGWGQIKKQLLIGEFLQTLSILLNQKLDLLLSLEKAIESVPNTHLREKLFLVPISIQQGLLLSHAFKETNVFSPFVLRLTQLGEESGTLAYLLEQAAKIQLRNTLKRLHALLAWTEPVLVIIIGIMMMWIVAATVVPLYDNLALFDL